MHAEFECQLHGYSPIIQTARDMLAFEIFCLKALFNFWRGNTKQGMILGVTWVFQSPLI